MARSFNGTSDKCDLSNPGNIGAFNTSGFSMSCWFYQTGTNNLDNLNTIAVSGNTYQGFFRTTALGSTIQFGIFTNANHFVTSSNSSTANAWNQVVGTWDTSTYSIYLNNTLTTLSDSVGPTSAIPSAVSIGYDVVSGSRFFVGRLADFAFWNTPLAAGEAKSLFQGARPYNIRPASLKFYLPLDGLQSPEPDLSGDSMNGTLTGTALAAGPPTAMFTPRWPQFVIPPVPPIVVPIGFISMPGIVIDNEMISI